MLCYLSEREISEADRLVANIRGYLFCGLVGMIGGKIEIEHEPFLEAKVLVLIAALRFAQDLGIPAKGDAVSWLENLHKLEDVRPT